MPRRPIRAQTQQAREGNLAPMEYTQILYTVTDRVLTITMNRPERMNAYTRVMMEEMIDALDRADADDNIRAVVVTGAGKAFCAGADLGKGGATFDYKQRDNDIGERSGIEDHRDSGGILGLRIFRSLKPVIAAMNGSAVGIGLTMTLPMDIRILSGQAKLGFVFARRGISPEACSTWILPRIVGIGQAQEWVLTGRIFNAEEALRGRLVSKVLPAAEVLPAALAIAREIAENTSAVSVALARQMLWTMLGASDPMDGHRIESQAIHYMGASADAREGVQSFLEKRTAAFTMKPSEDMPSFYPWREEPPFRG